MKYSKILILFILATIVFAACQKDEPRVNFALCVADQYTGGNGKVYIDNESNKPRFYEDEAVRINGETYLIDYRSGSPAVYDVAQSASGAYYAIYPSSWVNGSASATPSIIFPDMQEYRMEDGHQVIENPMVAYSTSGSTLNFYNVAALVTVKITNSYGSPLKVKYVSLYSDNTPLSGTATIDGITTPTPSVRITKGITNVSIDCKDLLIPSCSTQYVTFAVPPIDNIPLYVDVYLTDNAGNTKYSYTKNTYEHNPEDSASNQNKKTIHRSEIGVIPVDLHPGTGLGDTKECGYFWGGGSSEADPYIIMDKDDLGLLRALVANNNTTYNNSGVYYLQTAHIDLSDSTEWTGIGTPNNAFKANYDGSNAWVKLNIRSVGSYSASHGIGLFGDVSGGGKIINLTTKGSIASINRNICAGGIAGKILGAFTIENCHNEASISTQGNNGNTNPYGGICGNIDATSGIVVNIKNSTNSGTITRNTYGHIGGICGLVTSGKVTFEADTNKGLVTGNGAYFTGGICGACSTSTNEFKMCVNEGDITSEHSGVGGIVGFSSSEVHISGNTTKNTGKISGTSDVGGIVGRASKAMINQISGKTINEGAIIATSGTSTSNGAGGIIGNVNSNDTYNTIKNCWNKGTVNTSGLGAGGIVGRTTQCKINCCKNSGTIIVNSSAGSYSASGGIVGFTYGGASTIDINNCGVESCDLSATDKMSKFCGGIVGYARDNVNITNCYAFVNNMYGATSSCGIMGFIDYTSGSVTVTSVNCYSNFYAQSGSTPTATKGTRGNIITTYVYCNSNYAASPSSTTESAGYPTAYFSTSYGTATTGDFYNSNSTLGAALRDYRKAVLNSGNDEGYYMAWTSDAIPKLDWIGAGIFSSTD